MADNSTPGLIAALNDMIGGGATALAAALAGRLMWHAGEVRSRRRPILSWSLLWELPLAFGMALIGDGLGAYLGLGRDVTVGLIAVMSYLGPHGAGAIIDRWLTARRPD